MGVPVEPAGTKHSSRNLLIWVGATALTGALIALPFGLLPLGLGAGAALGVFLGASVNSRPRVPVKPTTKDDLDALNAYTEGKMKRYTLLFGVNGGAFALAQFLLGDAGKGYTQVLPIPALAQGAIVFTGVMTVDIWLFGRMMRERFVGDGAFTLPGKMLLLLISFLLIGGWLVALRQRQAPAAAGQQDIAGIAGEWKNAYNGGDAAKVASLYAEDGYYLSAHILAHGREAIQAYWRRGIAAGGHIDFIQPLTTFSSGDLGYAAGTYQATNAGTTVDGRILLVFKRISGHWLIAAHQTAVRDQP